MHAHIETLVPPSQIIDHPTTFETTKFWTQKMIRMLIQVLFSIQINAPKQSGGKKRVHDGLGFYSHRPSLMGGIMVYKIAKELA
jgi:hypothetical protein